MYLSSLFSWGHLHPILVHFTTALLPVSVFSDVVGKFTDRFSFTPAAWWMLLYGAIATPITVFAGWMWVTDITSSTGGGPGSTLTIHEWLGSTLALGFLALAIWRGRTFSVSKKPGIPYLVFAGLVLIALMYQGFLGGKMTLG